MMNTNEASTKESPRPSRKRALPFCGLALVLALTAACDTAEPSPPTAAIDGGAPEGSTPPVPPTSSATAARPDTPPYAVRGPFAVGYQRLEAPAGAGGRALLVKAWYPATGPAEAKPAIDYQVGLKRAEWPTTGPVTIRGQAVEGAPIERSKGPYPIVVFSHGYSMNPEWYSALLEHYASWGVVVVAPEHAESDWLLAGDASFDRPSDVKRTLDLATELSASGRAFAGAIDMKNVAVAGHSYGGYTALAIGGARFDLAPFTARCAGLAADDPKAFFCAPFVGKEKEMATKAGLSTVPTGLWPTQSDPRVTAILPMMGDAYLFGQAGLASVTVPMMVIGGTDDDATPWEWGSKPSYDYASSAQKSLVAFAGANHFITTNPCESMPWVSALPPFERDLICFDQVWDKARALDLVRQFSTTFLLATLRGDAKARAMLSPTGAPFRGVAYSTTLK